jgi:hypothetical protein
VEIFVGVQTSADDIFFIKPKSFDTMANTVSFTDRGGREWEVEHAILRQAIRDQSFPPFEINPDPDALVFFPYVLLPPEGSRTRWRARVLSRAEMVQQYPKALAYFTAHEHELREQRNVSPNPGESFWAYGRSQSLTKLDDPKVIVRVLSLTPRYATDTKSLVAPSGGDGGPYYLLRPRPECPLTIPVLVALLSHPAVDAYIASRGKAYRGSYVVHRKAFLAQAPVPSVSATTALHIERMVSEIQDLMMRSRTETDTALRTSISERIEVMRGEVEALITDAFGLTEDDVSRACA